MISVISIKGTDCRLEDLGQLTDTTNGAVDIVEPLVQKQRKKQNKQK